MGALLERIEQLRFMLGACLQECDATEAEGASALASLLFDILVVCHSRGDDANVVGEMKRMADRLYVLADTPPHQVQADAAAMADSTAKN